MPIIYFLISLFDITACVIRVHGKGSWEQIFFVLICQIHLKIGGSSQEEISLGFMSLCVSLILGNNNLGGNFSGGPVFLCPLPSCGVGM
ncbi:hypothetical protein HN51_051576 [Arachis hypogaea]